MHTITRARERFVRPVEPDIAMPPIDPGPLLGTWMNFDLHSAGIVRAEIRMDGDTLVIGPFGAKGPELLRWGGSRATVFSADVALRTAIGLLATFELGFQRVLLVGYVNRGLLTLEAATTFTDGSRRTRYLTRQHFYRLPRGGHTR